MLDPETFERDLKAVAQRHFKRDNPGHLWVSQSDNVQQAYLSAARLSALDDAKREHTNNQWAVSEATQAHGSGSRDAINAGRRATSSGLRLAYLLGWYAGREGLNRG